VEIDRHPSGHDWLPTKYASAGKFVSAAAVIDTYRKHFISHVTGIFKVTFDINFDAGESLIKCKCLPPNF